MINIIKEIINNTIPQLFALWSLFFIVWQLIVKPFLEPIIWIKNIEIIICIYAIIFLSIKLKREIWQVN